MTTRFTFRRVNEITGTFVLIVIAALVAAVVWTSRSQRWFKSHVALRIVLSEAGAAGIRQGSEVYFLGTLVGSVSDVLVDATGRMEARANIRRDFFRFVRSDSSAVVKKSLELRAIHSSKSRAARANRCRRKMPQSSATSSFKVRWRPR